MTSNSFGMQLAYTGLVQMLRLSYETQTRAHRRKRVEVCRRYQITFCHTIFGLWKDQAAISMNIEWISMELCEQLHGLLIGLTHWLNNPFHWGFSFSHSATQGSCILLLQHIIARSAQHTLPNILHGCAMQCTMCIYVKLNQQLLLRSYISNFNVLCDQKIFSPFLDCLGMKWYTRVNYVSVLNNIDCPENHYLYGAPCVIVF